MNVVATCKYDKSWKQSKFGLEGTLSEVSPTQKLLQTAGLWTWPTYSVVHVNWATTELLLML